MPDYPLWWSKPYRKKSLEQVALTDYPYLTWSEANIRKLNDAYRARIADIRQKLNNYTPSVVCDRCSEPAGVLSIVRYASGFEPTCVSYYRKHSSGLTATIADNRRCVVIEFLPNICNSCSVCVIQLAYVCFTPSQIGIIS